MRMLDVRHTYTVSSRVNSRSAQLFFLFFRPGNCLPIHLFYVPDSKKGVCRVVGNRLTQATAAQRQQQQQRHQQQQYKDTLACLDVPGLMQPRCDEPALAGHALNHPLAYCGALRPDKVGGGSKTALGR